MNITGKRQDYLKTALLPSKEELAKDPLGIAADPETRNALWRTAWRSAKTKNTYFTFSERLRDFWYCIRHLPEYLYDNATLMQKKS